jgi:hypothetical protein
MGISEEKDFLGKSWYNLKPYMTEKYIGYGDNDCLVCTRISNPYNLQLCKDMILWTFCETVDFNNTWSPVFSALMHQRLAREIGCEPGLSRITPVF